MKRQLCLPPVIILLFFAFFVCPPSVYGQRILVAGAPIRLCFTPGGDCTNEIVAEIGKARSEILLQAYSFTSKPIVTALVEAHKRGVKVLAILDKSQRSERYTTIGVLIDEGIPTYIDAFHAIAHNKIMVIDRSTTITGSFNFTKAAQERNAENLLIVQSKELAGAYAANWQIHKDHSVMYQARQ